MFDLSLPSLIFSAIFSIIGYSAWKYGKRETSARHMLLAVALFTFGYFMPNAWVTLGIGCLLTFLLFWP